MRNDGGPAFPVVVTDWRKDSDTASMRHNTYSTGGMSLRDYFAAAALQGMLSGSKSTEHGRIYEADADGWARIAYTYADHMLAERVKS